MINFYIAAHVNCLNQNLSLDKVCERFKLNYNGSNAVDYADAKLGIHTYVGTAKDSVNGSGVYMSIGKEKVSLIRNFRKDELEKGDGAMPGWNGMV